MGDYRWAVAEIKELKKGKRELEQLLARCEGSEEKTTLNSMINELRLKIYLLRRYIPAFAEITDTEIESIMNVDDPDKYKKPLLIDPSTLSKLKVHSTSERSFEDDVLDRICGEEEKVDERFVLDIDFLPDRQREVITMIAQGVTYSETAETMNVKKGTVSKQLQVVRKRIRENQGFQIALNLEALDQS